MKKVLLSLLVSAASLSGLNAQAGDFSISFYGGSPGYYPAPAYYAPSYQHYGRPVYYSQPAAAYGHGYRSGFGGYGPSYYAPNRGGISVGSDFGGSYFYYSAPRHR